MSREGVTCIALGSVKLSRATVRTTAADNATCRVNDVNDVMVAEPRDPRHAIWAGV